MELSPSFRNPSISVIGLGYIGLPTAAMFASQNLNVVGVDIDFYTVDTVNKGRVHIVEPFLEDIVNKAVSSGHLVATTKPRTADVFLIAVPTPFKDNHIPDLRYVKAAAKSIAPVLKKGDIVILESTSPVGTTEDMTQWLAAARPDLRFPITSGKNHIDVNIAYCPERVLPGNILHELVYNDRIIGGLTPVCSKRAMEVYQKFVKGELLVTGARTAEMIKLVENAFRDVNIAFSNELSIICDKQGLDVREVINLANHHPRVNILQPGCGVGGHCLAVDPWFIVDRNPEEAQLIRKARQVNNQKPRWVISKIKEAISRLVQTGQNESSIRVALLGLTFKPNIDDLRESPALEITENLCVASKSKIMIVEPYLDKLPVNLAHLDLVNLDQALAEGQIIVVLVAHNQFHSLQQKLQAHHIVLDMAGIGSIGQSEVPKKENRLLVVNG